MDELKVFDLDAGLDEPSDQDYKYEEVFGEFGGSTQDGVRNRRSSIQNQNLQKETYYACPIYALTHVLNELNAIENEKTGVARPELDALNTTREIVKAKETWFRPKMGGTMQGALGFFKKQGWIDGYTLVKKVGSSNGDQMRQALNDGFILYTGSNTISWKETCLQQDAIVKIGKSYGHIICIDGYDGDRFHIRQSVGYNYFDKGYAYIKEDQISALFSVYAVIDKDNTGDLFAYKAKSLGFYNGERNNDLATRLETATIFARASGKSVSDIYSGERPNDVPTPIEMRTMTERAFDIASSELKTRKEVASFAARNKI